MMLHIGQDNFVPFFNVLFAPAIGYQVYRFCGTAGENHLFDIHATDETSDVGAGLFKSGRRSVSESMQAAMDVRVVAMIEVLQGINYDSWLMCCGGIIKID